MSEKKSTKTGMIGADTIFLIDFFKGDAEAVKFMRKNSGLLRISEMVIYEFLCGNLNNKEIELFFEAVQSFSTIVFNREAAVISSNLFRKAKKSGKTTGHADCMIAGSYLAHGIQKIVSRNIDPFKSINEIEVVDYYNFSPIKS